MEKVIQEEIIKNQQIVYSKWNKLIIYKVTDSKFKMWFNILKYGLTLLILIFGLMSLWFSSQWQTENVLNALGINISQYSSYITSGADGQEANNLIQKIIGYRLWDLKGAVLNESGIQALVAMGLLSLFFTIPILIFKNGTAWSIGSMSLGLVFLIIVIILFSLGLNSQSNALSVNVIGISNQAQVDGINNTISNETSRLNLNDFLTPEEWLENNKINNHINELNKDKDKLLSSFQKGLILYLNKF